MKKLIFLFLTSIMSSGILTARDRGTLEVMPTTTFQNNLNRNISISRLTTDLNTSQISSNSSITLNNNLLQQSSMVTINVDGRSFVLKNTLGDLVEEGTYTINNLTRETVLVNDDIDEFGEILTRRQLRFKLSITKPSGITTDIYQMSN